MRNDNRKQDEKFPNIDLKSFIYKNYKDILATFIFIFCMTILVFSERAISNEKLSTVLISSISGSLGYLFGKKIG